eukprot:scaffold59135_cov36-Tisochrysis_lutea.AAC.2
MRLDGKLDPNTKGFGSACSRVCISSQENAWNTGILSKAGSSNSVGERVHLRCKTRLDGYDGDHATRNRKPCDSHGHTVRLRGATGEGWTSWFVLGSL